MATAKWLTLEEIGHVAHVDVDKLSAISWDSVGPTNELRLTAWRFKPKTMEWKKVTEWGRCDIVVADSLAKATAISTIPSRKIRELQEQISRKALGQDSQLFLITAVLPINCYLHNSVTSPYGLQERKKPIIYTSPLKAIGYGLYSYIFVVMAENDAEALSFIKKGINGNGFTSYVQKISNGKDLKYEYGYVNAILDSDIKDQVIKVLKHHGFSPRK